ncbi:MAG: hypothetical protein JW952_08870 [Candidatus Eisenbacteria bacterium]|nr:hypothetical protein [Candidatus Eisenbacteria bacterium]
MFDTGQLIDSIASVSIVWSGLIVAGTGHGDGVLRDSDEWFSWPGQFCATMYPDPGVMACWYAYSPATEGAFAAASVFDGLFTNSWDFLRDGEGTVRISIVPIIVLGGICVIPPQGALDEAKLVIDYVTAVESLTWGRLKTLFK